MNKRRSYLYAFKIIPVIAFSILHLVASGQVFTDAAGNVGIGTTTPVDKLHVSVASGNTGIRLANLVNGVNDFAVIRLYQGGTYKGEYFRSCNG